MSRSGRKGAGYAANSYRTEAIVLRTHRLGEADRIVVMLTPDQGIVRASAKGIRKTSSRFGATLEPFMHSTVQLVRGRGSLEIVSQAALVHPYAAALAADYDVFTLAHAMAETVERLPAVDDDGHRAQFRLFHGALAALARRLHPPRLILYSFLLRSLAGAGWAASFTACARCGLPGPHRSVNVAVGGSVCDDCRPSGSMTPAPGTVELLAALAAGDWGIADASEDRARHQAAGIVSGYLQYHLERRLSSLGVLDQVLPAPPARHQDLGTDPGTDQDTDPGTPAGGEA